MAPVRAAEIDCVSDRERAAALLHPLRLRILRLATEPISSTELGERLHLPRQRVHYHVRHLASKGLLRRAGRRRRRNMIEQRYVAAAQGLVLSPELLGSVGADWRKISDAETAAFLIALSVQMQRDVIAAWRIAESAGRRLSTLSIKSQFRFGTAEQREAFAVALREAVVEVIGRQTSPNLNTDGGPAPGRPYRLVLGCYPYAGETPSGQEEA